MYGVIWDIVCMELSLSLVQRVSQNMTEMKDDLNVVVFDL